LALSALCASFAVSAEEGIVFGTWDYPMFTTGGGRVCLFDKEGKIVRTAPTGNNADAWYLENGNFLFADGNIKEYDPQGKLVWSYSPEVQEGGGAYACQRLLNGNTVVGENASGRVVEVDKEGKVVFSLDTHPETKNAHDHMRMCRKLKNGNYLVCMKGDKKVKEFKPDGTVAWEHSFKNITFAAVRLLNGNTLVSSLDQVTEVTPNGKEVWEFKATDLPDLNIRNMCGLHVLKNGNIVIGNYGAYDKDGKGVGMFEITRDKKLVWAYVSPSRKDKSMMGVQKLDGDFNPLR
jgi:outer membrane protein assembly factor BamB